MTYFYIVLFAMGIIAATIIVLSARIPVILAIVGAIVLVFGALLLYAFWIEYPIIMTPVFALIVFVLGILFFARGKQVSGKRTQETLYQAMKAAGHDGTPRTFVLKDGSRYSGMIFSENGQKRIETSITLAQIDRVEYPR